MYYLIVHYRHLDISFEEINEHKVNFNSMSRPMSDQCLPTIV